MKDTRVKEKSLEGYAMKDRRVTEKSLEGYAFKYTPVNVLQRKDTPVDRLQRKVNLSPGRYRERKIVSPRFVRQRKEILLASCTNWYERKGVWRFSAGYVLKPVHARYTSRLPEYRWNIIDG